MATLAAIRAGLATSVNTIVDLQVSPYLLSNPTPPSADISPAGTKYDLALKRGSDLWTLTVRVIVGTSIDQGSQKLLDKYMASSGSLSVKAAIEANPTLSGVCEDLIVRHVSGYRTYGGEGKPSLLGAEWEVNVWATG